MNDNVRPILPNGGDQRCATLVEAIVGLCRERGGGMPIPAVLGCLRMAEHQIVQEEAR